MRRLILLGLFLFIASSTSAQIRFDTLGVRPIGPGMVHTHIIEHNTPWNIHVVEIDLTSDDIRMQALKGQNRRNGLENVPSMASRYDRVGHRVAAAINADFFASGVPVGMAAVDGEIVVNAVPNRQSLGFSESNEAMLEVPSFSGTLSADGEEIEIRGVNRTRQNSDLVLYNSFWGATTGTSGDGVELLVAATDGWAMNRTVEVVVESIVESGGSSAIPVGKAVLSATGDYADQLLAAVSVDDVLEIDLTIAPGIENLKQIVSGGPFLLRDGQVDVGPRGDGVDRHPRTAAGLDESGDRLYLVTVDGRQGLSAGMTLHELAEFMLSIGAYRAANLDGGGSTTLVVHGEVTNSVVGQLRPVTNGLAVITTADFGDAQELRIRQPYVRLFREETRQIDVDAFDENLHLVPFDESELTYQIDDQVGTISEEGVITASASAGSGYAYVYYGDDVDSVLVTVKDIERIEAFPTDVVVDTSITYTFEYTVFDGDDVRQSLPSDSISWSVVDEAIGWIEPDGTFHGLQEGSTGVVASYRDAADTVRVEVQLGSGITLLDDFATTDGWNVTLENLDASGSGISVVETDDGELMLQVDYRVPANASGAIRMRLEKDFEFYGVPELVKLDVQSDGGRHRIYVGANDHGGNDHQRIFPFIVNNTEIDSISASMQWTGATYPMRLTQLTLQFAPQGPAHEVREGTLLLDNLRLVYPDAAAVSASNPEGVPHGINLHQNYPNPFNPSTTIRYELPSPTHVTLRMYNVLGQLVDTLVDAERAAGSHEVIWEAGSAISSGVYFYTLEADGQRVSRSMMLLK